MEIKGRRELVVMASADAAPAMAAGEPAAPSAVLAVAHDFGATVEPLFGMRPDRLRRRAQLLADAAPSAAQQLRFEMPLFHVVEARDDDLDEIAESLRHAPGVAAAYVKPAGEPPRLNAMQPSPAPAPTSTPDFEALQGYLDPAPVGIDARYAWTVDGGTGAGVHVIDLEWGWRFTHEDLQTTCGLVGGVAHPQDDHGTAVLGEMTGTHNGLGVRGICAGARVSTVAFSMPSARAIRIAADRLRPGDLMLLEIHRPGPRATGNGQEGFIAIEWWPDDFAAIRYAVGKGIIVVEAAGNGAEDLDDAIYDAPAAGFPASWRNPFRAGNPSSEAVLVGAGAPPPGTHGANHGPDRSRLDFSNYGSRVDAQGWGREVTTTGYGDLQGGSNRDEWYTNEFSGTSSASPIVTGALACVQGVRKARGLGLLTSRAAIDLLRRTGSPQAAPVGERIGNRPDLREIIDHHC